MLASLKRYTPQTCLPPKTQRRGKHHKFQTSLDNIASSRLAWSIYVSERKSILASDIFLQWKKQYINQNFT